MGNCPLILDYGGLSNSINIHDNCNIPSIKPIASNRHSQISLPLPSASHLSDIIFRLLAPLWDEQWSCTSKHIVPQCRALHCSATLCCNNYQGFMVTQDKSHWSKGVVKKVYSSWERGGGSVPSWYLQHSFTVEVKLKYKIWLCTCIQHPCCRLPSAPFSIQNQLWPMSFIPLLLLSVRCTKLSSTLGLSSQYSKGGLKYGWMVAKKASMANIWPFNGIEWEVLIVLRTDVDWKVCLKT